MTSSETLTTPILLSREEAMHLLSQEPIRHFPQMTLLQHMPQAECHTANGCLFVRGLGAGEPMVFLAVDADDSCEPLLSLFRATDDTIYVEGFKAAAYLHRHFHISRHMDCVQLYLPDRIDVAADEDGIVDLTEADAGYVHAHYDHRDNVTLAYLKDRILQGPAVGILVDGVLAGYVLTHEEMTMGALQVLPAYRRMGLGTRLNAALVKRMRDRGLPAIIEVIHTNLASLALAASAGFEVVQRVHWMHIGRE